MRKLFKRFRKIYSDFILKLIYFDVVHFRTFCEDFN